MPRYPEMLRQAGIEGMVLLEFVIGADGRVDSTTINVLQSTNRAFEGPSKDVIARSLYSPGEVGGEPVATLATQQIGFSISTETSDLMRADELSDDAQGYIRGLPSSTSTECALRAARKKRWPI
jgi:TonB family protein